MAPTDGPLLEIVVVSYRCRELLRACLASLERRPLTVGEMRVHVVDNGSADGTVEMVRREFPQVRLHALAGNAGFAAANNLVLSSASAPYLLLLNPDTEVTGDALDRALRAMERRPEVGMLGCRLVRPDGTFDHAAKRAFPTPLAALAHFTGVGRRRGAGARLGQYRAPWLGERDGGEVDAVNGAFMLVRRKAVETVGLLDEGYWLYMEDLDWCYRFHRSGWKVWYDGGATVIHVKGGSSGNRRTPREEIAFHRGMGRFYRKFQAPTRPLLAYLVYLGIGAKLAVSLLRGALAHPSPSSSVRAS